MTIYTFEDEVEERDAITAALRFKVRPVVPFSGYGDPFGGKFEGG